MKGKNYSDLLFVNLFVSIIRLVLMMQYPSKPGMPTPQHRHIKQESLG